MEPLRVIDSHTAGEPTRVILSGGPDLGKNAAATHRDAWQASHDHLRSALMNEPRGSDVMVGAWLGESTTPGCLHSVVFFNNVGYLGMCGHGLIGVVHSLAWLGRIHTGEYTFDTPAGPVGAVLHGDGSVSIRNVPSHRMAKDVEISVPDHGPVIGDVAWGGNFFFLTSSIDLPLVVANAPYLTEIASRIRAAVNSQGFPEVDHVELFGPPGSGGHSRNFVLCPGGVYDRSPCGTGTSAKLACLAADGKLAEGEIWEQESILGTRFQASYIWEDRASGAILPTVTGRAHVTADAVMILDPADPLRHGIGPAQPSTT
jgi:4-hydroxyproline epimerase